MKGHPQPHLGLRELLEHGILRRAIEGVQERARCQVDGGEL